MNVSTLETTPRTNRRGAVSNTDTAWSPFLYAGYTAAGQALQRAGQPGYFDWLDHIRPAAGCTRPIRLTGTLDTIDPASGTVLATSDTRHMPDGVLYKACGNRRHTVCPSCARTYQRDAYHLLRAGLVGGRGVPDTVARHPAVFLTLTAPSFGTVHSRAVKHHTCADRRRCQCRPEPCHARRDTGLCEHRRPAVCWARHEVADPQLGQPLCLDCYDHAAQVVWNHHAGLLWRRTKQAIDRHLAKLARRRRIPRVAVAVSDSGSVRTVPPVRVSHGKAAEFQARGVVHFHALLRLDGIQPFDPDAVVPPPAGIGLGDLVDAITTATAHVGFTTPPHPDRPHGWSIGWGDQVDIRPITLTGRGEVSDSMVAGYLAKYATKSTETTGHTSPRLRDDIIDLYADPDGGHVERLIDACWHLGRPISGTAPPLRDRPPPPGPEPGSRRTPFDTPWTCTGCGQTTRYPVCPTCDTTPVDTNTSTGQANPYAGLQRWAHMLGFGGHFLTKARRYSITFRLLRDTRITYRRTETTTGPTPAGQQRQDQDDELTTLIVGTLTYAGTGWHTTGDALLANTAATQARARHDTGREELAHELGTTLNHATPEPVAA